MDQAIVVAVRSGLSVALRSMVDDDKPFIFATWLRGYRSSSPSVDKVSSATYFAAQHRRIARLLQTSNVIVAVLPDAPAVIVGYAVVEVRGTTAVIHWAHVKGSWQRLGVARRMLEGLDASRCVFTHLTKSAAGLMRRFPGLTFNPYLLEE